MSPNFAVGAIEPIQVSDKLNLWHALVRLFDFSNGVCQDEIL